MDWSLEVVVLPVSEIDRSIAFYRDEVGCHLDHDAHNEHAASRQRSRRPGWSPQRSGRTAAIRADARASWRGSGKLGNRVDGAPDT